MAEKTTAKAPETPGAQASDGKKAKEIGSYTDPDTDALVSLTEGDNGTVIETATKNGKVTVTVHSALTGRHLMHVRIKAKGNKAPNKDKGDWLKQ